MKPKVFILVEWETEKNYLNGFKSNELRSPNIQIEIFNKKWATGIQLAEWTKQKLDKQIKSIDSENRKLCQFYWYIVFDKDKHTQKDLEDIKNYCKVNDIKAFFSNQAFEVWLLLHFWLRDKKVISKEEYYLALSKELKKNYLSIWNIK